MRQKSFANLRWAIGPNPPTSIAASAGVICDDGRHRERYPVLVMTKRIPSIGRRMVGNA
jgi:hypothetical protein